MLAHASRIYATSNACDTGLCTGYYHSPPACHIFRRPLPRGPSCHIYLHSLAPTKAPTIFIFRRHCNPPATSTHRGIPPPVPRTSSDATLYCRAPTSENIIFSSLSSQTRARPDKKQTLSLCPRSLPRHHEKLNVIEETKNNVTYAAS